MKVYKKKSLYDFNPQKIKNAILQAYNQIGLPDFNKVESITEDIVNELKDWNEDIINVTDIENLVMSYLYKELPLVAREYSSYKMEKERIARNPTETEKVFHSSDDISAENANKDLTLSHIKNAYLAEIPSTEAMRNALPANCLDAHDRRVVYFHDMAYSFRSIENCLAKETRFITSNGVKSFYDFNDGDIVYVLSADGEYHKATVHCFGKQKLYRNRFYRGKKSNTQDVLATKDHRWYLKDGSITTNLSIGDRLLNAPYLFNFHISDEEYFNLPLELQLMWCKGFAVGDGCIENKDRITKSTRIRLCGDKNKYLLRFNIDGCTIRNQIADNGDHFVVVKNYNKTIPNFDTIDEAKYFFLGLYAADGRKNENIKELQSSDVNVINFIETYAPIFGAYISKRTDLTGQITNYGKRKYTICFKFINCRPNKFSYILKEQTFERYDEVWCLNVEDTHNFVLENGIVTGNCRLLDLDTLLHNGFELGGRWIETPKSFLTACTITTQILSHVTGNSYGLK